MSKIEHYPEKDVIVLASRPRGEDTEHVLALCFSEFVCWVRHTDQPDRFFWGNYYGHDLARAYKRFKARD